MSSTNPSIRWSRERTSPELWFEFEGQLTLENAENAIGKWRDLFSTLENEQATIVWDCRKMRGYDAAARTRWVEALKELKSQISRVWLISDSSFIQMGASFMGMIASLNIKAVASEHEITDN